VDTVTLPVPEHFLDGLTHRVALAAEETNLGTVLRRNRRGPLTINLVIRHSDPAHHVRHNVTVNRDVVLATLASVLQGHRPDIDPDVSVSLFAAMVADAPDSVPQCTVDRVAGITLFGSAVLPRSV